MLPIERLEPLFMHLFVPLLIKETADSDNWHFLFNTLKNENKEDFLKGSTFFTFELTKKNIYYGSDYPRMLYPKFI